MHNNKINTKLTHFDNLNLTDSAKAIKTLSQDKKFSYVVTPNIDHLARLCNEDDKQTLMPIYQQADLSLCDSRIVEKMLRFLGKDLEAVVAGSDLTKYIFENTITNDDTVLIIGGDSEQISELTKLYPDYTIVHHNPSMGFINKPDEVEKLTQYIIDKQAHYIFLAVGSPRQEILAAKLKNSNINQGVALCIGASINFIVGSEKRAPTFMQAMHLEWLFRMLQDPKRLIKRYAMNALYIPKIFSALRS